MEKSKIAAEEYILSKLRSEDGELKVAMQRDKRVYILRPCMIHGPGNKGNLNLLYNVVRRYPLAFRRILRTSVLLLL